MAAIPIGEFSPDQPDFGNPGSAHVRNVIPRTAQSYGPMPSLATYSGPLPGPCLGAFSGVDASGNVQVFAGTSGNLHKLAGAATAFSAIGKAGGYATAADGFWRFTQFGNLVLAANLNDPLQAFDLTDGAVFADLSAAAPRARYISVVRDWVVVANTYDGLDGPRPQRVWWGAIGDATDWPAIGSTEAQKKQSDFQDLLGDQGWIQGLVGNLGTADAAIFFERAIYRMVYAGAPAIFAFQAVEGARGCPAPGSIVQLGSFCFYLGEDGFYQFDGSNSLPIGAQKVDKWFFADLDQTYMRNITAAVDPINKLVFWAYPAAGSVAGKPNRLIMYNWALGRWSVADIDCEMILRTASFGFTLDGLDALGLGLDELPFSLDSRIWTGGKLLLSAFDQAHRLAYFTGPSLAAEVETTEGEPAPGRRVFVSSVRPLVDGGAPSVAVGTRARLVDDVAWKPAVPINAVGDCPQRATGRYLRARLTLPAGSGFAHIQGVDVTAAAEGKR